jgi:cytochrome c
MKKIIFSCLISVCLSLSVQAEDGKAAYTALCSACHKLMPPPTIAPPMFGVKRNVMRVYPQRDDFVNHVVTYVHKPDAAKSLMPHAVERFKLMPTLPYPEEKVRAVAEFLFDNDLSQIPDNRN